MPRKPAPPGHYTATEAAERLGISVPMLYNHVRSGNLHRIVPKGRKQGFFLKSEVDRLRVELYGFLDTGQSQVPEPELKEEFHFLSTTKLEDLIECSSIAKEIYGSEGTPIETRLAWMKKNPEILYVVRSDRRIGGYAYILPIGEAGREKVDRIFRGEVAISDITDEDIEELVPGKPLDIYIMSVVTRPGLEKEEKRLIASQLIIGLMDVLTNLGRRGIIIRSFLARSHLPDGLRLLHQMQFTELPSILPGRRNFIIDVEKSDSLFVRSYKRALRNAQRG